jgi:tetratricopeptide (TPR) repeat protein
MLNPKRRQRNPGHWLFVYWLLLGICCPVLGISHNGYALNLDKAKVYFLKGNYQECIGECENVLARSGYSRDLDELYYMLGISYMKQGNLLRASDVFEIIINEFKDSGFQQEAQLGLGDIYFLKSDYENAENKYKQILQSSEDTRLKGLILFRLAQCALKEGNWQEAQAYQDKLNKDYPLSFEKRLAKDLSAPQFYFTVQVGAFSNMKNARKLCQELSDKGYSSYVVDPGSGCEKLYRVRVGKLDSRFETKELEKRLIAEGYPTKIYP